MGPAADASSRTLHAEADLAAEQDALGENAETTRPKSAMRDTAKARKLPIDRKAAILQMSAALLWLPQAGLLAIAVGQIVAGNALRSIFWLSIAVVAIGILRALFDAAGTRRAFIAARHVVSERREQAIAALSLRSPLDIGRPASGLAASVLAEQAEAVLPYLARFRPIRLKATLVPVAILLCVLPISWVAAFVLLISAPLIPLFMALIGWRAKAASEKQLVEMGSMNAFLLDRLRGLATLRSFEAVEMTAQRLRANAESLRVRTMAVLRIAFLSSAVLELFAALGVAMVAVYVGFHLLGHLDFGAWGKRLSLAEGLFILLLAPAFFEPLRELASVWHDRAAGEAALAALVDLANADGTILGAEAAGRVLQRSREKATDVRIDELSFRHAGSASFVFENTNLHVRPGERVALLGPSGSGKSTLLALIAGLASFEDGSIQIDGEPLGQTTAAALRRQMIWIGQRPHIFAGSISDNISLGRQAVGSAAVDAALQFAKLQHVANARGDAQIGEGGSGLSGGEILRLALARAAVDPHGRLIIADEPTAHLDFATANDITERLLRLSAGKTLIVATHDPILASRFDRIITMSQDVNSREAA